MFKNIHKIQVGNSRVLIENGENIKDDLGIDNGFNNFISKLEAFKD